MQPALAAVDQRLAVRREGVVGPHVQGRKAFLVVVREATHQHALGARVERARHEHGPGVAPAHVDERLAIGRDGRPHRAADAAGQRRPLVGRSVVADDGPQAGAEIGLVRESRAPRGVVNEPAITRGDRASCRVQFAGDGELHATATEPVVQPQLVGRQPGPLALLVASDEVVAIGQPRGAANVGGLLGRERPAIGAVCAGEPEVLHPAFVRGEGDGGAIGRKSRVMIVRRSAADGGGGSPLERQRVEVAQQVEDDLASVGRHVHRHPRALARVEGHGPGIGPGRVDSFADVLGFRRLSGRRLLLGGERRESEDDREGEQQSAVRVIKALLRAFAPSRHS